MWQDDSTDAQMAQEAREIGYKEKAVDELLDSLEEARRRIEVIRSQLANLGFDMRLLEES